MLGNKVQEAFTDLHTKVCIRRTRQHRHAGILAFCASGMSVEQNIVR
jgi:hypothetical protein